MTERGGRQKKATWSKSYRSLPWLESLEEDITRLACDQPSGRIAAKVEYPVPARWVSGFPPSRRRSCTLSAPEAAWTSSRSPPSSYSVSRAWRMSETAAPWRPARSTSWKVVVAATERCESTGEVGVEPLETTAASGSCPPVGVEVVRNPSSRWAGPGVKLPELSGASEKSVWEKPVEKLRTCPFFASPPTTGST